MRIGSVTNVGIINSLPLTCGATLPPLEIVWIVIGCTIKRDRVPLPKYDLKFYHTSYGPVNPCCPAIINRSLTFRGDFQVCTNETRESVGDWTSAMGESLTVLRFAVAIVFAFASDPWLLAFTDITVPSLHRQDGRQYDGEVILSHVYSQNKSDKRVRFQRVGARVVLGWF